ncbi:acyl-CoA dehydrogenase family protein [Aestuariivivens sediminicola]|uniref:acyl-CoA dehydrogenase family protein n=1 Tax=Aestuariivivens sediminicola TaxID=2913560 RepID=UPI001F58D8FE|nr:acyl-CoA dehydrogenase family protein [Aestuariivivens sediminicola]
METLIKSSNWTTKIQGIGTDFARNALKHDLDGTFVKDNYLKLKELKFFSAAIPVELGGAGVSHKEMCDIIRTIAHYCSSTALAFSMHQHLISAAVWNYKHKGIGQDMLRHVAENELALISTGARDWLGSNGEMRKTSGGYIFSGTKHFASQSAGGDVVVTSGTYLNKNNAWEVLHFSVPMTTSGVSILDNWDVMGMRGTGSNSIRFEEVFIPDSAITLSRPKNEFHPVWHVVLTVALPLIMSAYVGIAEKAKDIAIEKGKTYHRNQNHIATLIGRLNNVVLSAQTEWKAMYNMANELNFKPGEAITIDMLSHKTNVGENTKKTVAYAMEAIGGQSFYRSNVLERLFRDVQASPFHPLPKWEQYAFTGKRLLKL